ncbi:PH domain-containing protein [Flavobacterium sp. JP2137]|uniref:PH domain-containing protein n=1 Tax=Flavobacterium sp. JP2137 TaxID=3414510 RepID=UPI003D3002CE
MKEFSNQDIDTSQLPRISEVSFVPLDPRYKKVVLIRATLIAALIVLAGSVFYWWDFNLEKDRQFELLAALSLGTAIVIAVLSWVLNLLGFAKKAYAFREHDVIYKSGIVLINQIVIPYNRVQHAALHEGMLSRMFQLATLEFFTAGGAQGDLSIPGIPKEQAERIKQFIVDKVHAISADDSVDKPTKDAGTPLANSDITIADGPL